MKIAAAILLALGLALAALQAHAAKRVALVLGNGAYAHAPALPNPRRDAEAMATALERLGFQVELGVDLDLAGMRRAVLAYARALGGADVALFYYAGHGMQVFGQNYLLPVDAEVSSEIDLDFSAMPARLVLAQMERWPATRIVILDACRDNPFATALSRSMGKTRAAQALSRGLARGGGRHAARLCHGPGRRRRRRSRPEQPLHRCAAEACRDARRRDSHHAGAGRARRTAAAPARPGAAGPAWPR